MPAREKTSHLFSAARFVPASRDAAGQEGGKRATDEAGSARTKSLHQLDLVDHYMWVRPRATRNMLWSKSSDGTSSQPRSTAQGAAGAPRQSLILRGPDGIGGAEKTRNAESRTVWDRP
jgi:hypothetical protein